MTDTLHAVRSAWGYRTQAVNQTNQALTSRAAAGAISPGDGLSQGDRRKLGVF